MRVAIVIESVAVAVCATPLASITLNPRLLLLTTAVGVPLITPVEAFSVSPAGMEPDTSDQVKGVVPPAEASVCK